ncbi:S8 family serine peptidase [Streptomyces zagrosensis]|uniref:Subtilisin family serine protease n=1 Tax=Streptomyces zagrosensis TaxID=1042984 RepID=A0A7W9UXL7_9ACTN|nr:S8 family serine peptidase [Streptomyces zagrosensis]MBB5935043.1 subtilisin family serine protease [Streptomyces zagrosensis]
MRTTRNTYRWLTACCTGLAATAALAMTGAPAQATADNGGTTAEGRVINAGVPGAIDGLYIVSLKGTTPVAAAAESAVADQADQLTDRYGGNADRIYTAALRGFSAKMTPTQAKRLAADPDVAYVQQSLMVHATEGGSQSKPPSWGLDAVDGKQDEAYNYPGTGAGVTAYVIDSGTRFSHQTFEGRATSGYDFLDNDADASDCYGHGTHVAGTIAGKEYGVAKKAKIVAVRVLDCKGNGPDADTIEGIDWVIKNGKKPGVINMSLGSGGANADPQGMREATKRAVQAGFPTAISAGNSNQDSCGTSPGDTPEALSLGSTDSNNARSSFSNYGRCIDLFAPGGNINSASNSSDTGKANMSGTSMASPHAAGALAIYLEANPNASATQATDAVIAAARDGVVTNPGTGSPNKFLDVTKLGGPVTPGKPTAEFTPTCSEANTTCTFDASASTDADGSIASYAWEFGDGKTGEGVKPSHTYDKSGSYEVKLTVTDNSGKTGTVTKKVSTGKPAGGVPPVAQFSVSCWNDACSFDASRSTDKDGDIASYDWKFGDGKTGTGVKVKNTYPAGLKTYTAALTVTDRAGNAGTAAKQIQCRNYGSQTVCFGN